MYRLWYGSTIILLLITVLNSVSVYEQFLNHKLKILQVYYSHKEHLARVAAVHNGVMNYIRTKQEIRLAFYKLIRCPFVLVGSIGGAVERGGDDGRYRLFNRRIRGPVVDQHDSLYIGNSGPVITIRHSGETQKKSN